MTIYKSSLQVICEHFRRAVADLTTSKADLSERLREVAKRHIILTGESQLGDDELQRRLDRLLKKLFPAEKWDEDDAYILISEITRLYGDLEQAIGFYELADVD